MKRLLLGLAPLMMFASTVTFDEALKETFANNKELKAKKLNIELAKEDLKKAKSYDWGRFFISEDITRTNNALYVFGNKLESREATFLEVHVYIKANYAIAKLQFALPQTILK